MGAVIGVTYAARTDWYEALLSAEYAGVSRPGRQGRGRPSRALMEKVRRAISYIRTAEDMVFSWGPGTRVVDEGRSLLRELVGTRDLAAMKIPVAVCATDLSTGERVVLRSGDATAAVYASAALAGVLPPISHLGRTLVDGAYTDIAPIDVAREMGVPVVIAVDPGQLTTGAVVRNGLQAAIRAMEICHRTHADLRFDEADLVLRPRFRRPIDTLEFSAYRECVAAGFRAVRAVRYDIDHLLTDERGTEAGRPRSVSAARAASSAPPRR